MSKDLLDKYMLKNVDDSVKVLILEKMELIFYYCKELNSLSLRNKVNTFKYLQRF